MQPGDRRPVAADERVARGLDRHRHGVFVPVADRALALAMPFQGGVQATEWVSAIARRASRSRRNVGAGGENPKAIVDLASSVMQRSRGIGIVSRNFSHDVGRVLDQAGR